LAFLDEILAPGDAGGKRSGVLRERAARRG